MPEVLYIPGFRERDTPKEPGNRLKSYCDQQWIECERFIYPGDPKNNDDSLFSLSALEEKIFDTLNQLYQEKKRIVSYSYSAFPTAKAISRLRSDIRDCIESVTFLHPAIDPIYSTQVIDWMIRGGGNLFDREYYLDGDPEIIYSRHIGNWRGDGEKYLKDLKDYDGLLLNDKSAFRNLTEGLRAENDIRFITHEGKNDCVTDSSAKLPEVNRPQLVAKKNHIPELSGGQIYRLGD